ncbi:MAG: hypothetical protein PVI97_13035 [Candidatus Thiodiazotropha sp.]
MESATALAKHSQAKSVADLAKVLEGNAVSELHIAAVRQPDAPALVKP